MAVDRRLTFPVTREWAGSGNVTLRGNCWGDPRAPLVLLLHGGGQTRHAWKQTGERLARRGYHAVALDARGHGESDWSDEADYSPATMAADIAAVAAAIAPPSTALVGASMGGGASIVAASRQPDDFHAIVLVDMVPQMEPDGVQAIWDFLDRNLDGFASLEDAHEAVASYQPHRKRERNLDGLKKNLRLRDDGRYHWHWDPKWSTANRDLRRYMDKLQAAAEKLTVPALLLRGVHSNVLSQRGVDAFLRACPHAEYVNVKDAAHMIAGDRNDIFADAVIDFLGRAMTQPAPMNGSHEG